VNAPPARAKLNLLAAERAAPLATAAQMLVLTFSGPGNFS